jgi:hypothetical protein
MDRRICDQIQVVVRRETNPSRITGGWLAQPKLSLTWIARLRALYALIVRFGGAAFATHQSEGWTMGTHARAYCILVDMW